MISVELGLHSSQFPQQLLSSKLLLRWPTKPSLQHLATFLVQNPKVFQLPPKNSLAWPGPATAHSWYQLLSFYFCDETPSPRQLIKPSTSFEAHSSKGLEFMTIAVGSVAAGKQRWLRAHTSIQEHEAEKASQKWHGLLKHQSSPPETHLLQQGHTSS